MLLFVMVLQLITLLVQALKGSCLYIWGCSHPCAYWMDVLEGWQWEWILVDWLANVCHAFSSYSLDSTTRLGVDMLHAFLVPLPEFVILLLAIILLILRWAHLSMLFSNPTVNSPRWSCLVHLTPIAISYLITTQSWLIHLHQTMCLNNVSTNGTEIPGCKHHVPSSLQYSSFAHFCERPTIFLTSSD